MRAEPRESCEDLPARAETSCAAGRTGVFEGGAFYKSRELVFTPDCHLGRLATLRRSIRVRTLLRSVANLRFGTSPNAGGLPFVRNLGKPCRISRQSMRDKSRN